MSGLILGMEEEEEGRKQREKDLRKKKKNERRRDSGLMDWAVISLQVELMLSLWQAYSSPVWTLNPSRGLRKA